MKYCEETTRLHPLSIAYPTCVEKINNIIYEETNSENRSKINRPFNEEVGLKLDKVKENCQDEDITKGTKSVDMVLGLKDKENAKMLLVDFKLNCRGINSLSQGDFTNKIKGSKRLLFGSGIKVYNVSLFIFNNEFLHKEEARHNINKKLNNLPSIEVLSINELKEKYF